MSKLRVVIGNVDIETDGSPESAKVVRDLMSGLLSLALGEAEPPQPKTRTKRLKAKDGE